jgi:hypothetical protein
MPISTARRFSVHEHDEAPGRGRLVRARGFEDAALQFVETWHPAPDTQDRVSLTVEDCASGERQCFRIDLATGRTQPCK